jgi:hypothetical protein
MTRQQREAIPCTVRAVTTQKSESWPEPELAHLLEASNLGRATYEPR